MPGKKKTDNAAARGRGTGSRNKRREGPVMPLTRENIVSTALKLVDREGLKALSMRRLGAELGVDPMAVYYHVPNKQALLDSIVEAVMAGIDLSVDNPAAPLEERVLRAAHAYRDAMLAHVNALPILLSHGPSTEAALRPVELLIGILRDAGLPPAEAFAGMNAIAAAVRGVAGMSASWGGKPPAREEIEAMARNFPIGEFPHLHEAMPYAWDFADHGFDFGIRALARGLLGEGRSRESMAEMRD
jgi:AcrR family transcriptional regulator